VVATEPAPSRESRREAPPGEDRRAQLLRHAADLLAERGYAGARVSDIAARAGVAKGLLYWYFPSKEALVAELVKEVQLQLRRAQGQAIEGLDDPLEQIYVGSRVAVHYVAQHYHLYGSLNSVPRRGAQPPCPATLEVHARDTTRVLTEGQHRGVVRRSEPATALAWGVSALVNELVRFHALGVLKGSVEEVAALAARSTVHLVAADRALAEAVIRRHGPGRTRGRDKEREGLPGPRRSPAPA